MRSYETMFVVNQDLSKEDAEKNAERFSDLVKKNGELVKLTDWGKRSLAYEINDKKEGYYFIINFNSEPEFVNELERQFKLNDDVIRHIILRTE